MNIMYAFLLSVIMLNSFTLTSQDCDFDKDYVYDMKGGKVTINSTKSIAGITFWRSTVSLIEGSEINEKEPEYSVYVYCDLDGLINCGLGCQIDSTWVHLTSESGSIVLKSYEITKAVNYTAGVVVTYPYSSTFTISKEDLEKLVGKEKLSYYVTAYASKKGKPLKSNGYLQFILTKKASLKLSKSASCILTL